MIETIKYQDTVLAIVITHDHSESGVRFLTPTYYPLQMAYMSHNKGKLIQTHKHISYERIIKNTQEVLIIKKGKLKISFYDDNKNMIEEKTVTAGDIILLVCGAHGFEVIEDLEMIEIKQGPFCEDKDKIKF